MSMSDEKPENDGDHIEMFLNRASLKTPVDVVDVIGGHGPWQFRQWIVFFVASLCNSMIIFSALFLPVQTICFEFNTTVSRASQVSSSSFSETELLPKALNYTANNRSDTLNDCNSTKCADQFPMEEKNISYSELSSKTQCWDSQIETIVKLIYFVACIFAEVLVYFSAKRFGRRNIALISCIFLTITLATTSITESPSVFIVLRFFVALGVVSIYLISAFSLMEYVHKDYKILYFLTGHLGWGIAHFLLPAVAWLADNWTSFNLALTFLSAILSGFVWWGPESPSSYSSGTQLSRSKRALKYAAFTNGYSTSEVDMMSHDFHMQREKCDDDMVTSSSSKKRLLFYAVYSFLLLVISFNSAFMYFAAKWHPEWLRVVSGRVSFSFLGSTEVAASIILLFLSCFISVKYLLSFVSALGSAVVVVIYARNKDGLSTSSAILYTGVVFFSSAAWTLMLAKSFCHKVANVTAKLNLIIIGFALFAGALTASASVLKENNRDLLLVWGIPNLLASVLMILIPDDYFGRII